MGGVFSDEKQNRNGEDEADERPSGMPKKRGGGSNRKRKVDDYDDTDEEAQPSSNRKRGRSMESGNERRPLVFMIDKEHKLSPVNKSSFLSDFVKNVITPYYQSDKTKFQFGSKLLYREETKECMILMDSDEGEHCTFWFFVGFNTNSTENVATAVYVTCMGQPPKDDIVSTLDEKLRKKIEIFMLHSAIVVDLIEKVDNTSENIPNEVRDKLESIRYATKIKFWNENMLYEEDVEPFFCTKASQ